MNFFSIISQTTIPLILMLIALTAFIKGKSGYNDFIKGACDGIRICEDLLPTLIGLLLAVGILRNSGALTALTDFLSPVAKFIHFPTALVPLVIIKMFSSAAATSLLLDIYKEFGPDSYNGYLASVILASTETILYLMAVYSTTAKIKHTRYILSGALISTLAGVCASTFITNLMF